MFLREYCKDDGVTTLAIQSIHNRSKLETEQKDADLDSNSDVVSTFALMLGLLVVVEVRVLTRTRKTHECSPGVWRLRWRVLESQ